MDIFDHVVDILEAVDSPIFEPGHDYDLNPHHDPDNRCDFHISDNIYNNNICVESLLKPSKISYVSTAWHYKIYIYNVYIHIYIHMYTIYTI